MAVADYVLPWDEDDPLSPIANEPTKANQALHDYFGMGSARSLAALAREYHAQTEGVPPTRQLSRLKEWSTTYHWQDRVAAADAAVRAAERAAWKAARERRAAELAERNWAQSQKLAERVAEMLAYPLSQVEQVTKRRQMPDGRTTVVEMQVVRPARWSFQTAAIMADIAAKLGALAIGEPTDRMAHTLEGLTQRELESMPMDQLLALRAQLERG